VVFIAIILQFFFPVAVFTFGDTVDTYLGTVEFYLFGLVKQPVSLEPAYKFLFYLPLIIIAVFILALTVLSTLQYKKRLRQLRTINFAILLNIVLIVLLFFYTDKISKDISLPIAYKMGSVFPLISLVFLVLAMYAIKKDERLVRSLDRLR
jgi:glucan phosphoethanolaminetransferase (alkaline phosphatase superfamily)